MGIEIPPASKTHKKDQYNEDTKDFQHYFGGFTQDRIVLITKWYKYMVLYIGLISTIYLEMWMGINGIIETDELQFWGGIQPEHHTDNARMAFSYYKCLKYDSIHLADLGRKLIGVVLLKKWLAKGLLECLPKLNRNSPGQKP